MSELSPKTRALLDAARAAGGSTPEDRARVFAAVAARTGLAAGGAAVVAAPAPATAAAADVAAQTAPGAVVGNKLAVVIALVSALGAALGVLLALRTLPIAPAATQARPGLVRTAAPASSPAAPAPDGPAPLPSAPAPVPAAPPRANESTPATDRGATPTARARTVARVARAQPAAAAPANVIAAPPSASPVAAASTLADELALVRGARAAIRAGDHVAALALLDQHAARFPAGMLREERDANRVIALCRLARRADAARAAADFFVTFANSPYAARVRSSCTGERP